MADDGQVAAVGNAGVAPAAGEQGNQQEQRQQQPSILRTILTQLFIMYLINSFFRSGKNTGSGPNASVGRNLFSPNQSMVSDAEFTYLYYETKHEIWKFM